MSATVQQLHDSLAKLIEQGKGDYELYVAEFQEFLKYIEIEVGYDDEIKEAYIDVYYP